MENNKREELSLYIWWILASLNFSQFFNNLKKYQVYYRKKNVIHVVFLLQKTKVLGNKNCLITEMGLVYFKSAAEILKKTLSLKLERKIKKKIWQKDKTQVGASRGMLH